MSYRTLRRLAGAVLLGVVIGLTLLLVRQPPAPAGGPRAGVIARVNGRDLPASALLAVLGEYVDLERLPAARRDPARGPALVPDLIATFGAWQVQRAFDRCVYAALADAAIVRAGVVVDPGAVQARYAREEARWAEENGHGIPYDEYLRRSGRTPEGRKRELARDVGLDAVLGPPSEAALRAHFERLRAHFEGRQVLLRHILVATEVEAEALRAKLLGGADFAKLAEEHSTERATAKRGGLVAWVSRRGDVPEPLAAAAFGLKVGAVGGPVHTVYGWHLVRVDGVRDGTPLTYAQAAPRVGPDLAKVRRVAFMTRERRSAQVERLWASAPR